MPVNICSGFKKAGIVAFCHDALMKLVPEVEGEVSVCEDLSSDKQGQVPEPVTGDQSGEESSESDPES